MQVAFASTDGAAVDVPFAAAPHYFVWEVGPTEAGLVLRSTALARGEDADDVADVRARAVAGCVLVYALEVDDLSTARLLRRRVVALSTRRPRPVVELVAELQETLRARPPRWLRRALAEAEPEATAAAEASAEPLHLMEVHRA